MGKHKVSNGLLEEYPFLEQFVRGDYLIFDDLNIGLFKQYISKYTDRNDRTPSYYLGDLTHELLKHNEMYSSADFFNAYMTWEEQDFESMYFVCSEILKSNYIVYNEIQDLIKSHCSVWDGYQ